ncbi:histidine triad nucleotide-binding protein [Bacteriovorax sp. PP10]|uniref:Histidine triad nucleotide-binding protein n=1 Tax=Bacteriovorax antarcticus TaxID=3088717 RepID=A0ABU5VWG9_9BACT|nr:histidine triad nucleotide-binding protein [Bacteriovorax sp. PP10]MEA9356942.1 histidine triad nucleotide-binding protein [Bacteriovorax sp. PP10]
MSADCLFCKIVEGKIPASKTFENDNVIGFVDIHPQAKIHLLFVHKTHTADINELSGDPKSLGEIFQAITEYTKAQGLDKNGFRVVTNLGKHAGQTVFHTHFHVLSGEHLGRFGS